MLHGKLQTLDIPIWKLENMTMDFITKLPKILRNFDTIWVIADRQKEEYSLHFHQRDLIC